MKFSYSDVWADLMGLLRAHASLIATVAGVFIFLPGLLLGYFAPQPEAVDSLGEMRRLMIEYAALNWPWLLLNSLVGMIGAIVILLLVFVRNITVGGAIAAALPILPFYFATSLLSGVLVALGFVLLIVPGLYLFGRFSPITIVVVAENRRNPIDALARCWALTRGQGWAIFGLVFLVAIAAAVVIAVATTLIGILFVLIAGQDLGQTLVLIVRSAGNAALVTLILLLNAAIYRRLSQAASAAPAD